MQGKPKRSLPPSQLLLLLLQASRNRSLSMMPVRGTRETKKKEKRRRQRRMTRLWKMTVMVLMPKTLTEGVWCKQVATNPRNCPAPNDKLCSCLAGMVWAV